MDGYSPVFSQSPARMSRLRATLAQISHARQTIQAGRVRGVFITRHGRRHAMHDHLVFLIFAFSFSLCFISLEQFQKGEILRKCSDTVGSHLCYLSVERTAELVSRCYRETKKATLAKRMAALKETRDFITVHGEVVFTHSTFKHLYKQMIVKEP